MIKTLKISIMLIKLLLSLSPIIFSVYLFFGNNTFFNNSLFLFIFYVFSLLALLVFVFYFFKNKTLSIIDLLLLIVFLLYSIYFLMNFDGSIYTSFFGNAMPFWGYDHNMSLSLIFASFVFLLSFNRIEIYKKVFYPGLIVLLSGSIFYLFMYFNTAIPSNYNYDNLLALTFIIVFVLISIFNYLLKYLNQKKYKLQSFASNYFKYVLFILALTVCYKVFIIIREYYVYRGVVYISAEVNSFYEQNKLNQLIINIDKYRKTYDNDILAKLTNSILEIERKQILNSLLTYEEEQSRLTISKEDLLKAYIDNVNRQLQNAQFAVTYNYFDYNNHIEMALAYEKVGLVTYKSADGNAYDKALAKYDTAMELLDNKVDSILVMKAKLWLNRIDKDQSERETEFKKYIQEAIDNNPKSYDAYYAAALYYTNNHKNESDIDIAKSYIDFLLTNYPNDKNVQSLKELLP